MSEKTSLFSEIKEKYNNAIILGDKGKCKIFGIEKVGKYLFKSIKNVCLVDGLKFDLLSISQLCE